MINASALVRIGLAALLLSGAAAAKPAGGAALSQFLGPRGELVVPVDYAGSIDSSGYTLISGPDEAPRFAKSADDGLKYFGVGYGCNGAVSSFAKVDERRFYLVGKFTSCGDAVVSNVAIYDPRTRRFSDIGDRGQTSISGNVTAIAVAGSNVYIGGNFSQVGGVSARNLARWDGSQWHALGAPGESESVRQVYALAATAKGLYVGGDIPTIGSANAGNVAYWDLGGDRWSTLGSGADAGADQKVYDLAIAADGLYVAGTFDRAGGAVVNHIARWDGERWHALAGGLISTDSRVQAVGGIASDGYSVYASGTFSVAGIPSIRNIARWDGTNWNAVGDPTQITRGGGNLAVSGRDVYAVGLISGASLANFDGSAWRAVPQTPAFPGELIVNGSALYVGGTSLWVWNGTQWTTSVAGAPRPANGPIEVISVQGANVYIGGRFTEVNGVPANAIARWNGTRWQALGSGLADVRAIVEFGSKVYAGGNFTLNGESVLNNVAAWDGNRWTPLGAGIELAGGDSSFGATVAALAEYQGALYVGGSFRRAGGQDIRALARWDGNQWSTVGSGFSAATDVVLTLAVFQSELYVGGRFSAVGGDPQAMLARWNGARWAGLATALPPSVSAVRRLRVDGDQLWIGSFLAIFRWNGAQLSVPAQLPILAITTAITDFVAFGSELFLTGNQFAPRFTNFDSTAHWDGQRWSPFYTPAVTTEQSNMPLAVDGGAVSAGAHDLRPSGNAELISRTASGATANGSSTQARLSRDGKRVAFTSAASNLVPVSGNRAIYLRNRSSGVTTRVSDAALALESGPLPSFTDPALSADGSTVAMTASSGRVYAVRDGRAQLVSQNASGAVAQGTSAHPMVTSDGLRVAFDSDASNLVDGDSAGLDVYLKHLGTGAIESISRTSAGVPADAPSSAPWSSDDGRRVAFVSSARNLAAGSNGIAQVLLSDVVGGSRRALLVSRNLTTGEPGNAASKEVRLTPDGRFGVFVSAASNLVAGDSNGVDDVYFFAYDGTAITRLERVSTGNFGNQGNGPSMHPSLSDDAAYIAFATDASNLVMVDRNGVRDVMIKNLGTGEVLRQSASVDGLPPAAASDQPEIDGDAVSLVFASDAANLVADDANGQTDVYWAPMRVIDLASPGPGVDQPGIDAFALPVPNPAFASCPAGFFIATVDDGPGVGLSPGLFGLELLLDERDGQSLDGGLNFGGMIDVGQAGFAGFNVQNPANEPQRLDLNVSGYPTTNRGGSLPVRIRVMRQPAAGVSEVVYERVTRLSTAQPLVDSVVIQPGFHVVTVVPDGYPSSESGGLAEGQIFVQLGTRFVDRVGGGFFAGVVVGGYHAPQPFNEVSGFAAFCISSPHTVSVHTYAAPEYGSRGAQDLRVKLYDYQRREILSLPTASSKH